MDSEGVIITRGRQGHRKQSIVTTFLFSHVNPIMTDPIRGPLWKFTWESGPSITGPKHNPCPQHPFAIAADNEPLSNHVQIYLPH